MAKNDKGGNVTTSQLSEAQVRQALAKMEAQKQKRLAYNKTYNERADVQEKRKAYMKQRNERLRAEREAVLSRAKELGIVS